MAATRRAPKGAERAREQDGSVDGDAEELRDVRVDLNLTVCFIAWKLLLLAVVLLVPAGDGYDTSGALFLRDGNGAADTSTGEKPVANASDRSLVNILLDRIATRLTRWDALYFVGAAARGQVHEQDWAFSTAYSWGVGLLSSVVKWTDRPFANAALNGALVTNLMHFLSVQVLYRLVSLLVARSPISQPSRNRAAYVAAVLHIVSPAGVFLLAPYAEAPYAMFSFLGMYLYALAFLEQAHTSKATLKSESLTIVAGVLFGIATMLRTNGLFNGLIFAYDVLLLAAHLAQRLLPSLPLPILSSHRSHCAAASLPSTIIAGSLIFLGFVAPQTLAYGTFCIESTSSAPPPYTPAEWCSHTVPSIYAYIQRHYWNVGFLRYWKLSNAPLFALAAPMLVVLALSAAWGLGGPSGDSFQKDRAAVAAAAAVPEKKSSAPILSTPQRALLTRLALPQLAVALVTLTTAHVQIVNRLASGYPLWYMWLAVELVGGGDGGGDGGGAGGADSAAGGQSRRRRRQAEIAVRVAVVYALVQAALFGAFLPPA